MNERTTDAAEAATRLPEARDRSYTPPHGAQGGAMTGVEAERRAGRARTRREPLARADRIQIAMFAGLVTIFASMLGAGTLGFTAISGQLLDMQQQIGGLRTEMHDEIGGLRTEMHDEIGGLRTEMQAQFGELRTEMQAQFGEFRTEMHDEIGTLSERIGALAERVAAMEALIRHQLVPSPNPPPPSSL